MSIYKEGVGTRDALTPENVSCCLIESQGRSHTVSTRHDA
jgi:hypothetical protein